MECMAVINGLWVAGDRSDTPSSGDSLLAAQASGWIAGHGGCPGPDCGARGERASRVGDGQSHRPSCDNCSSRPHVAERGGLQRRARAALHRVHDGGRHPIGLRGGRRWPQPQVQLRRSPVAAATGPAVAKPELAEGGGRSYGPSCGEARASRATGPAATAPSWLHMRAAAAPSMGAGPAAASAAAPAPAKAGAVSAPAMSALAAAMGRAALEAAICPAAGGDAATPSWLHRPDAKP